MRSAGVSWLAAGAALLAGGCQAAGAPAAQEALNGAVAAQRQCAPLLAGAWPIDLAADRLRAPGVDALVAAGLLTRRSVGGDQERPHLEIGVAPAGRDWVELRRLTADGSQTPFLCYGKRELVDVRTGDGDTAAYRYRVVKPAPWTARPDVQAAYPFLRKALAGPIEATAPALRRDGTWQLPDHADWQPGTGLDDVGFYPCLPDDRERACG